VTDEEFEEVRGEDLKRARGRLSNSRLQAMVNLSTADGGAYSAYKEGLFFAQDECFAAAKELLELRQMRQELIDMIRKDPEILRIKDMLEILGYRIVMRRKDKPLIECVLCRGAADNPHPDCPNCKMMRGL
jgi:hypothetical protein